MLAMLAAVQADWALMFLWLVVAFVVAVFVFAAQMVNFPVGAGTSGHLLGGALAAVLVGLDAIGIDRCHPQQHPRGTGLARRRLAQAIAAG